jgi:signal transduction histidine kinase
VSAPLGLRLLRLADARTDDAVEVRLLDVGAPTDLEPPVCDLLLDLADAVIECGRTCGARNVDIALIESPGHLVLGVRHDGRPPLTRRAEAAGERVRAAGATVRVRSEPHGTQVVTELLRA